MSLLILHRIPTDPMTTCVAWQRYDNVKHKGYLKQWLGTRNLIGLFDTA